MPSPLIKLLLLLLLATNVTAGAISVADVTPASLVAGASGAATATFTTANPVPADGKFVITFPANFDVTGATVTAITGQTGAAGTGHTINCAGQVCTVTRGTGSTPGIFTAGVTTVVFGVVKNPAVSGATGTFTITTTTNGDAAIDTLTTVPAVTITAGVISVADVTPASLVAGASGAATATFTTANPVPADGKFVITFPANFDVTGATVTAITGQTGAAGTGHMISCAGQVCTVTRGTGGTPGIFTAGVTTVVFGVVKNPAVSGATGTFTITTTTNGDAAIDTLATVPAVTIIALPPKFVENTISSSTRVESQKAEITILFRSNTSFVAGDKITITGLTGYQTGDEPALPLGGPDAITFGNFAEWVSTPGTLVLSVQLYYASNITKVVSVVLKNPSAVQTATPQVSASLRQRGASGEVAIAPANFDSVTVIAPTFSTKTIAGSTEVAGMNNTITIVFVSTCDIAADDTVTIKNI
eukprot:Stramenopile-MAST_4_protein_1416